jgi:hypothetical protein
MTTTILICYKNFINYLMANTGLPISEMQTLSEWVENRQNQFKDQATEKEMKDGFELYISKIYNH